MDQREGEFFQYLSWHDMAVRNISKTMFSLLCGAQKYANASIVRAFLQAVLDVLCSTYESHSVPPPQASPYVLLLHTTVRF